MIWKIKSSSKQVLLTVLEGNTYEVAKALKRELSQLLSNHGRPRLCCVSKGPSGFGFSVSAPEGIAAGVVSASLCLCLWLCTVNLKRFCPLLVCVGLFMHLVSAARFTFDLWVMQGAGPARGMEREWRHCSQRISNGSYEAGRDISKERRAETRPGLAFLSLGMTASAPKLS